jgi:hypothetical protein
MYLLWTLGDMMGCTGPCFLGWDGPSSLFGWRDTLLHN